jgi:hypothetical protein
MRSGKPFFYFLSALLALLYVCAPSIALANDPFWVEGDRTAAQMAALQQVALERRRGDNRVNATILQMIDSAQRRENQLSQKSAQVDQIKRRLEDAEAENVQLLEISNGASQANRALSTQRDSALRKVQDLKSQVETMRRDLAQLRQEFKAAVELAYREAVRNRYLLDALLILNFNREPVDSIAETMKAEARKLFNDGRRDEAEAQFVLVRKARLESFRQTNDVMQSNAAPSRLNLEYILGDFLEEARLMDQRIQRGERTTLNLLAIWDDAATAMPNNFQVMLKRADTLKKLGRWTEAERLYRYVFENAPSGSSVPNSWEFVSAAIALGRYYQFDAMRSTSRCAYFVEFKNEVYAKVASQVRATAANSCAQKSEIEEYLRALKNSDELLTKATQGNTPGDSSLFVLAGFEYPKIVKYWTIEKRNPQRGFALLQEGEKLMRRGRDTAAMDKTDLDLHTASQRVSFYNGLGNYTPKGIDWSKRYWKLAVARYESDPENTDKFGELDSALFYLISFPRTTTIELEQVFDAYKYVSVAASTGLSDGVEIRSSLAHRLSLAQLIVDQSVQLSDQVSGQHIRDSIANIEQDNWRRTGSYPSLINSISALRVTWGMAGRDYLKFKESNPRKAATDFLMRTEPYVQKINMLTNEARKSKLPRRLVEELYSEQLIMKGNLLVISGQRDEGVNILWRAFSVSQSLLEGDQKFGDHQLNFARSYINIVDLLGVIARETDRVDDWKSFVSWYDECLKGNICSPSDSEEVTSFINRARQRAATLN